VCTNQYHSLHTHPLFRHPPPPIIYKILLCFWGRVHESMSRPWFAFLIEKLSTRAEVVHSIAKWRITVCFSNCVGLIYLAIYPPSIITANVRPPSASTDFFNFSETRACSYHSLHTHPFFRHPAPPIIAYTIAQYKFPPDPLLLQYTPHNTGNGLNRGQRPSAAGT